MKNNTLSFLLLGVTLIFLIGSCSTSQIVFDVSNPAEIEIPEGIEQTTLINLVPTSGLEKVDNVSELKNNPNFKLIGYDISNPLYIDESLDWVLHLASIASPKYLA